MFATVDLISTRPSIVLNHGSHEPVSFSANVYQKESFIKNNYDVFGEINQYWATLPQYKQEEIWSVYKSLYEAFGDIFDADELYQYLTQGLTQFYRLHPLEDLRRFLENNPNIRIPDDVKKTFDPSQDGHTPSKTYTEADYYQLAALSLFLRTVAPILGEFVESTRRQVGVNYKEFAALKLLVPSGLMNEPAIKKLELYISSISNTAEKNNDRIMAGFSSEDNLFLNLALTIIRRLCVADLRGGDEGRQLVALVYNFIFQRTFNPSKSTEPFKEKTVLNDRREDGNRSTMEAYHKRTELSYAEKAGLEFGYEDLYGTAMRLAPNISKREIDAAVKTARSLLTEVVSDAQIILMSTVLKTVHAAYTADYISHELLVANLGVTQAVLWNWGHKYLAAFITSAQVLDNDIIHVSTIDSKAQMSKELQAQIHKHFPFVWMNVKKNREMEPDGHPVVHQINMLVDEITSHTWKMTMDPKKIIELFGEEKHKLPLSPNLRSEIAQLIVDIENRRN